ncbi:MAG: RIP metalloprotease RseP [Microscillaceae bacterium]|nr:RIP metalloprotease RseP [Microscillaceae bacterium]MDW8461397.1 RIP metalloprotease RseP [Cytophagales bacterium]
MDILIMAGQLILSLSILVGLHELGHLLTAKMFGMRVEKYYIGFPPKIIGRKWGETEYALGAIPLGGFVKITGMVDESLDTAMLKNKPEPYEFRAKPAWQRLIVMMGGIVVNIITGIFIFILLFYLYGETYIPAGHRIVAGKYAQEIGLQTGDKILKINGESYTRFNELVGSAVFLSSNAYYTVERNGKIFDVKIPANLIEKLSDRKNRATFIEPALPFKIGKVIPKQPAAIAGIKKGDRILAIDNNTITYFYELEKVLENNKEKLVKIKIQRGNKELLKEAVISKEGKLGFYPDFSENYQRQDFSLLTSISKGSVEAFNVLYDNIRGFGKIFRGELSADKALSGPIDIAARVFGAEWDWFRFWRITAVLSIILAFMNFLPIPALDGGHVMFLTYEIISGRKPSDKFLERAQMVGMVLLLSLMVFVIVNDILKNIF